MLKIELTLKSKTELEVLCEALAMYHDMANDAGDGEIATKEQLAAAKALLARIA